MNINFKNNRHFSEGTILDFTTDGTISHGIAFYNQRYSASEIYHDTTVQITPNDILNVLKNLIKVDEGKQISMVDPPEPGDYRTLLDFLAYDPLKNGNDNIPNSYSLGASQIVFFKSEQGNIKFGSEDTYSKYNAYYGFFTDAAASATEPANTWLIYIIRKDKNSSITGDTTPDYYPVVFKIQKGLEPKFTKAHDATHDEDYVNAVDCTIFSIGRGSSSEPFIVDKTNLKNTSFNISYEETEEKDAKIQPFCAFKLTNA